MNNRSFTTSVIFLTLLLIGSMSVCFISIIFMSMDGPDALNLLMSVCGAFVTCLVLKQVYKTIN